MGIPVFDIKPEASAALPFKTAEGAGKTAVENFTKIFDGCVIDCAEAKEGPGAKMAAPAKGADKAALAEPVVFNQAAVKDAAATDGSMKSQAVSDVVLAALPVEPLTVSPEPVTLDTATVKTVETGEGPTNKAVISENGVVVPSVVSVIVPPASEKVASCEAAKQDLSKGDTNTGKTKVVAEQIPVSTTKTDKTQKPAKPEATVTLKKDEGQPAAGVIPLMTSMDKPAEKTEISEAKTGHPAKASKKEVVEENISVPDRTEKPEGGVTTPTLLSVEAQPDTVAAVQEANKQASVATAFKMSAQ